MVNNINIRIMQNTNKTIGQLLQLIIDSGKSDDEIATLLGCHVNNIYSELEKSTRDIVTLTAIANKFDCDFSLQFKKKTNV